MITLATEQTGQLPPLTTTLPDTTTGATHQNQIELEKKNGRRRINGGLRALTLLEEEEERERLYLLGRDFVSNKTMTCCQKNFCINETLDLCHHVQNGHIMPSLPSRIIL